MQPLCTRETRQKVSRASVDDVPVTRPHSTQLAGLQQCLRPHVFHLHAQTFLTLALGELVMQLDTRRARPLAFTPHHRGQGSVGCGVGGQNDGIGHRSAAVWNIDSSVDVIFVVMGGKRAACWDVRDRQGMGESRDIFVPVST